MCQARTEMSSKDKTGIAYTRTTQGGVALLSRALPTVPMDIIESVQTEPIGDTERCSCCGQFIHTRKKLRRTLSTHIVVIPESRLSEAQEVLEDLQVSAKWRVVSGLRGYGREYAYTNINGDIVYFIYGQRKTRILKYR